MMGFGGQGMPMRRPQMGPSPMTAGRPNPMAGFQGGGQWGAGAPPRMPPSGGPPAQQQWGGGGSEAINPGYGDLTAQLNGPPPPGWQQHNNVQGIQADPNFQGPGMTQGSMGSQGMGPYQGPPQGMQAQVAQAVGGMSDAMMHPFAPRNRPQFPGAMQGGIMGGMMPQSQGPGMTPPWMRRQYQGL